MADKLRGHALPAIELLFEGEDHQHAVNVFANQLDAVLLPGPKLRADEEEDRNSQLVQLLGKAEVNLREGDEHGHTGPPGWHGLIELANIAVDARQMADDFGQAHRRHIFAADDALSTDG